MQIAEFSGLLEALYAAPLDMRAWHCFLDQLCAFTGSASGYILSSSPGSGTVCVAGGGSGFDPATMRLYNEHYGEQDSCRAAWVANPRQGVIEGESLVRQEQLLRSEFWNALLARDEFTSLALVVDSRHPFEVNVLSLWRDARRGPLKRGALVLLKALLPHLRVALDLRAHIQEAHLREASAHASSAADPTRGGLMLVLATGRVMFVDEGAARLLDEGDGLKVARGRLTGVKEREALCLSRLLLRAGVRGARSSAEAPPCGAMKVERRGGSLHLIVMPPTEATARTGIPHDAVVYLRNPAHPPASRALALQQLFALTPTESRLADLLLAGKIICEVADEMRITKETARYHLKHVFSKTGVRRQAELMHLGMSLPALREATVSQQGS